VSPSGGRPVFGPARTRREARGHAAGGGGRPASSGGAGFVFARWLRAGRGAGPVSGGRVRAGVGAGASDAWVARGQGPRPRPPTGPGRRTEPPPTTDRTGCRNPVGGGAFRRSARSRLVPIRPIAGGSRPPRRIGPGLLVGGGSVPRPVRPGPPPTRCNP